MNFDRSILDFFCIHGIIDPKQRFKGGNTWIHEAIHKNHIPLLKKAIEAGVDINAVNDDNHTVLKITRNNKIIKMLFRAGADPAIGECPLLDHWGTNKGFKLLLDYGATSLDWLKVFQNCVYQGRLKKVKFIIDRVPDFKNDVTTFEHALHYPRILKYLVKRGLNLQLLDSKGKSPLCRMYSTIFDFAFDLLHEYGFDFNMKNGDGSYVFSRWLLFNKNMILKLLLYGANLHELSDYSILGYDLQKVLDKDKTRYKMIILTRVAMLPGDLQTKILSY